MTEAIRPDGSENHTHRLAREWEGRRVSRANDGNP